MTTTANLMSQGSVFLQGDAIQILGQRTNQSYIESLLNVSGCYTISDYSCPKLDKYQKFLKNDFYIDVGLISVIEPIPAILTIPKTWFRFVSKSHLIELGETPPYYPCTNHSSPSDLMPAPYTVIFTFVQTTLASYRRLETAPKRVGNHTSYSY
ncbi:unnamed protein product [Lactuca saligna]|uniref:Uncharacterized protein n=1 Tax=Lactuca saligna TaxID=75948 RepID=A0AA35YU85_LACSI|nr:unnamed protein product [Lactuca saligna]